ncbi:MULTISPECIES: GGDEF domain-containing protein [unclassified Sedimentibacter]|uniref:GGDEF domain-containing protein n=1 Tax=unclassified Sedimentibacter TaxID=2649220 RepID=UPI0027E14213|nr:GGDEF domain-containing protein [Sedimentibacter sp. MB35-C1]WMJ78161.1 GGDEF domain-containing protein [Sedimentibacter sp. MB35-C1]
MELQTLQYIELNCFSIIILLLIFISIYHQCNHCITGKELFLVLIFTDILILFFDTAMWSLNGIQGNHTRFLHILSAVMYNILNPLICITWYFYVDFYINGSKEHLKKMFFPMLIPVLINLILSIASIFENIYFIIDDNNIYNRGKYVHLLLIICLLIIIYTTSFMVQNRKNVEKKEYFCLISFGIITAVGGIIQYFFYGVIIIWTCVTASILIIFINIQNNQLHKDYLTGLYNRRSLDNYLNTKIKSRNNRLVAGIMIDLNYFKMINDSYGHHIGDQALKYTASILKDTFRKNDFIARYGGDEFIVMMEICTPSDLAATVQRLKKNVSLFNIKNSVPYKISLSIGYDYFSNKSEKEISSKVFLERIDNLMYLNKQRLHSQENIT